MHPNTFDEMDLEPLLLEAVSEQNYDTPTQVQREAIPVVLDGRDVLALAQTGTGKTAAFSLPILHRLHTTKSRHKSIRVLVVVPTRELALQVEESLRTYGRHLFPRTVVVMGGVGIRPQIRALRETPDILVATPGRLLDLMGQGYVKLDRLETLVLDEADRMLDMGFIHDVRKIVAATPERKQTLFFSATMPRPVRELSDNLLHRPVRIEIERKKTTADNIKQQVLFVENTEKKKLLTEIVRSPSATRVLVFTRTRYRANHVVRYLKKSNLSAEAIHSDKTQGARQRALSEFARGKVRALVATDIVARGIDVDDISHVINYDLPSEVESYVHRIGRTARAGAAGVALSFCCSEEISKLQAVQKHIGRKLDVNKEQSFHSESTSNRAETPIRTGSKSKSKPNKSDRTSTPASQQTGEKQSTPKHARAKQARSRQAAGKPAQAQGKKVRKKRRRGRPPAGVSELTSPRARRKQRPGKNARARAKTGGD